MRDIRAEVCQRPAIAMSASERGLAPESMAKPMPT
jgi:hypothetical protein